VIAKNRSTSKPIHYDQKQRINKESQRAVRTTPKTPKARKEKVRSQVTEISQRKREIAMGLMVGNLVTQQGQSGSGKTNRKQSRKDKKARDSLSLLEQLL